MIRRPPRSTLSSSSAASDVYKRQYLHHLSRPAGDCKPVCPACCDAMIRTTLATEPMSLEKFCSGQDPVRPHKRPPIEQFCPQICSSKDGGEDLPCPGGKSFKELQAAESSLAGELSSGINDLMHKMLSLIHISEPTRLLSISYAVFCLKKKKKKSNTYYEPLS
eukprot:TRINITY_DN16486_c0_g1_i2.p1 TRINITY_DN16486_c0_g1~~TRINITY_DN16486_c0_g1_i2.p1  ORF type:complete len:164 (-),score=45.79 TRINITY_DN16486_c0_g1_i2:12-503(-)